MGVVIPVFPEPPRKSWGERLPSCKAVTDVNRPALCYDHDDGDDLHAKITFGELRASGVRDVLIYCRDHRCSHHAETNADGWADDVRLSDIEPNFTCTRCGKKGAEVRPKFSNTRMGTG